MTPARSPESGRADAVAVALSVLLGAASLALPFSLRGHAGWEKARGFAAGGAPAGPPPAPGAILENPIPRALAAAESVRSRAGATAFRPDPARLLRGWAAPSEGARVTGLDGRVSEGRLRLRWKPVPGSRGTVIRLEGLGGSGSLEEEVPADRSTLDVPVSAAAGTIVARALPAGASGPVAEARVSIPFRIPVEIVRAERASSAEETAVLVLRRPFDGRSVEAEFRLHRSDEVGGLSPAGPDGPVLDFRTDFVLDEVRALAPPPGTDVVPDFDPDGKVLRDEEGRPAVHSREGAGDDAGHEVVLRGPNDERRVLVAR